MDLLAQKQPHTASVSVVTSHKHLSA